jgi:hypothetical protein
MNKIIFPPKPHSQGSAVADLQDALQACLDRGAILATNEAVRRQLSAMVQSERATQMYGEVTGKLVSAFQQERHLVGCRLHSCAKLTNADHFGGC